MSVCLVWKTYWAGVLGLMYALFDTEYAAKHQVFVQRTGSASWS